MNNESCCNDNKSINNNIEKKINNLEINTYQAVIVNESF